MSPTLLSLLLTATVGAPEISSVQPAPLPVAASAEALGAGFVPAATSVTIGGAAQQLFNVQPDRIRFVVANDTPRGAQTLVVTTTSGADDAAVEVVGPLPKITDVSPARLVLGELATIQGDNLDTATAVHLGDVAATITEQTTFVIVFEVPFDESLLGTQGLTVSSPSGDASRTLEVAPPTPEIDAIAPNPARQGDLVEIRGSIVALNAGAKIGLVDAPLVMSESGSVTVLVPDAVSVGPHDVTVSVGVLTSPPEGPLYVQAAAPNRPVVVGVYPSNVARGGVLWLIGTGLEVVTAATHGLEIIECDKTACRLGTETAAIGTPFTAAGKGQTGAAVFTMSVLDEAPVVPRIVSVDPTPAFRGQTLTITGEDMQTLKTVVIGGRTQSVSFFGTNEVEITVHPETPLGAERLFLTANAGSEPFMVTVLDPFPNGDTDGEDTSTAADEDAGESDTAVGGGGDDDDCSGGGAPTAPLLALIGLLSIALLRRRAPPCT